MALAKKKKATPLEARTQAEKLTLTPRLVWDAMNSADRRAAEALTPFCVDVNSGVETSGAKDADKIHEFARAARMAEYLNEK
jgi:hypothetical protein